MSGNMRASGGNGDGEIREHLKGLTARGEDRQRQSAESLLSVGAPAVPLLLETLEQKIGSGRVWSAVVLWWLAQHGEESVRDSAVVAALAARENDKNWEVLRYSAHALGAIGTREAHKQLKEWSRSRKGVVRAWALGALAGIGDAGARQEVRALLESGTAGQRHVAGIVLGEVGDTEDDLRALHRAMQDADKAVRGAVDWAIGEVSRRSGATDAPPEEVSAKELIASLFECANSDRYDQVPRIILQLTAMQDAAVREVRTTLRDAKATKEAFRLLCWLVGNVVSPDARDELRQLAAESTAEPEMQIQCHRALARSGALDGELLEALEQAAEPFSKSEPGQTDAWSDAARSLSILRALHRGFGPVDAGELASVLRSDIEMAMRWEKRIQTERAFGVSGQEQDPLYAAITESLRTFKEPYYLRTARERASRLEAQGLTGATDAMAQREHVNGGAHVILVMEHEYLHPEHLMPSWNLAKVQIEVTQGSSGTRGAGETLSGAVTAVTRWWGPYTLKVGEQILFAADHVHRGLEGEA